MNYEEKRREKLRNLSPSEKEAYAAKRRVWNQRYHRKRMANMTPEEKFQYDEKKAENQRRYIKAKLELMTPEEKAQYYKRKRKGTKMKRKVLVVKNRDIHPEQGIFGLKSSFMDRDEAEKNQKYRQVIPYAVITRLGAEGVEYLIYRRGGTETRLHGLWTIGVGGHIDETDGEGNDGFRNAFFRELYEELRIKPLDYKIHEKPILLHENEVDRVHVGVLISVRTFHGQVTTTEEIPEFTWVTETSLRNMKKSNMLETWSVEAIKRLL